MARRFRTTPGQAIGLLFLLAIPMAALAGAFGERVISETVTAPGLAIRVTYPERYRYKQINRTTVLITNRSPVPLDTVRVAFDPAYLLRFSEPQFVPAATEAFAVALTDIAPGSSRLVVATMQAEHYGRHSGVLRVSTSTDTLELRLATFVFP